jgi:hypothetical protein
MLLRLALYLPKSISVLVTVTGTAGFTRVGKAVAAAQEHHSVKAGAASSDNRGSSKA